MQDHFLFNNLTVVALGVLTIGLFGWYCYLLNKKYQKPIGELLTWKAIKENESILVILMLMALLAESFNAATAHASNVIPPNPLSGMLNHIFIGAVGAIATLTFFRDLGSIFEKGLDTPSRVWRIVVIGVLGFMVVGSPIAQIMIMAGNLKQEIQLNLFLWSIFNSDEQYARVLAFYKLPENYSAWAALERNLKVSIWIVVFHFAIAFLEGARHMSSKERRGLLFASPKKEGDKKEGDKKDEKKDDKKDTTNTLENLAFLLKRLGYNDDDRVQKLAREAAKNHKAHNKNSKDEAAITIRIATLRNEAHKIDSGSYGNFKSKEEANKDLKQRIFDLFNNRVKEPDINKRGLGITTIKPDTSGE